MHTETFMTANCVSTKYGCVRP